LRVTCQNLDKEWELRSKTRSQEIAAVSEALAIITEDDNREMLYKSTSFIQEQVSEGVEMKLRRSKTVEYLRRRANEPDFDADDLLAAWHNRRAPVATGPRAQLSTLAITASLDSFTKVKEAMDKMVADLKAESQEEVELKAFCTKEFNENEKETYENNEQKTDLEAKMEQLAALIEQLQGEITDAQGQVAESELGVKKASQQREAENAEFQTTIADQRATQAILSKALKRLQDFYKKQKGGAFVQQAHLQQPPVQFAKMKDNAGASPVIGMMEQIIEDSKATENEATTTEREAQANYETFVSDSNNLIKQLNDAIIEKTKSISSSKAESEDAKADHTATVDELEMLAQHNAELHGQCDFVVANFDIRQKARLQEIEAIGQAKSILSGAK
jgi:peptidoglycan hydrolase CwlO-like protein